jgi:hypothetical protein
MNWPKMRPRFIVGVTCSVVDVMEALRERLEDNAQGIEGQLSERHGVLTIPEEQRQFWSPQLGLTVEDRSDRPEPDEAPTRVVGIFSPDPEIWTAFVFMIGTLSGIAVFGLMYAVVQLSMGWDPWALLAPLLAILIGGLVYTSTLVRQGLGADEMYQLRTYLDECLADAQARGRREPTTSRDSSQL